MAAWHWQRQEHGLRVYGTGVELVLTWYGSSVLRVLAHPDGMRPADESLARVAEPDGGFEWSVEERDQELVLRGPRVRAVIQRDDLAVRFESADGRELVREQPNGRRFDADGSRRACDGLSIEQRFNIPRGVALFGLGQYQDGVMNYRGQRVVLIQTNTCVVVPFLLTSGGFGVLWDNPSHTELRDDADGTTLWSDVGDAIDYYICVGETPDACIAGYRHLTGRAPLWPRWAFGLWQCKERYQSGDELVGVVREHRRRKLPLDCIVQDWRYWGESSDVWSSMRHDPEFYGDLPRAVREVHDENAKVMISIWPKLGKKTEIFRELAEQGLLFEPPDSSGCRIYDAFSEQARSVYWRYVEEGLFRHGIDAWWMDATEPELRDTHHTYSAKAGLLTAGDTAAGSWRRVLNAYSLVTTQGVHDGQRQASDEKRVVILTRSAYAGQQRYGAATWSGDIGAAWPVFKAQIPAGLNFCMSGIPYWTTDNGGFFASGRGAQFPEGVRDAAFRELFLRWFQYATFCPILRSHGTSTPREAWQFGDVGDPIYDTLAHFDELRARLVPYSYSLAARTTFEHYTPMRALAMEYPNDQRAHGIVGQFFYGPSLMACPMTEPVYHRPTVIVDQLPSELLVDAEGRPGAITLRLARREQGELASATHRVTALRWPLDVIEPPAGIELAALSVCFEGALNLPTARRYRFEIHAQGQVRFSLADRTLFDGELDPWCIGGTASVVVEAELPAGLTTLLLEYPKNKHETYLSLTAEELLPDGTQRPLGPPERDVYLPVGTWFDFWSGGTLRGGRVVRMAAPLERIPVLTRAGSILPLGPVLEHVSQGPVDPLELRVYPGADARFVLYEDAGDGYGYERGEHAEVELDWCDARRTLCISKRRGSFPGMLAQRTLCVVLVKEGHGSGVARTKKPDAIVVYDGNPREVVL